MFDTTWTVVVVLAVSIAGCSSGDLRVGIRDRIAEGGANAGASGNPEIRSFRAASIPIGIENVNNSPMKAAQYRALLRFVPDTTVTIDRFYFGFKLQGASCWDPGRAGDGAGDGGTLSGSLVTIDPATGLPNEEIANETVSACARHNEVHAEVNGNPVMVWLNTRATLEGGIMYGLIVRNTHADPEHNFFSFQMPIADTALSGPHARNELAGTAPNAIMSLDPREHVAWSTDSGATWKYGSENGQYRSYMNDNDMEHPATRIPQYGFRLLDGTNVAPQPFYAYKADCTSCTVLYSAARYARTFSEVGGFTASGDNVGTLTLTNTTTGLQASCTPTRGYGFRTCALSAPVALAQGDSYSISSTGAVELMKMDGPQRIMFPSVGTESGLHRACQPSPAPGTNAKDVPSLWAGPVSAYFPTDTEK